MASEPFLGFLKFARRPDSYESSMRQPLEHAAGFRTITRARVSSPRNAAGSLALSHIEQDCPCLSFGRGDEELLEVGFDDETQTQSADFRPALPLIMRW
jgi:hypothetical protein